MFFNESILSKKGPLAKVWLAAHYENKLTKHQVVEADIQASCDDILAEKEGPLALRLSGHLLLGVARIYSRKARYLLTDCSDAISRIRITFKVGAVDMAADGAEAPIYQIQQCMDEDPLDMLMMGDDAGGSVFERASSAALGDAFGFSQLSPLSQIDGVYGSRQQIDPLTPEIMRRNAEADADARSELDMDMSALRGRAVSPLPFDAGATPLSIERMRRAAEPLTAASPLSFPPAGQLRQTPKDAEALMGLPETARAGAGEYDDGPYMVDEPQPFFDDENGGMGRGDLFGAPAADDNNDDNGGEETLEQILGEMGRNGRAASEPALSELGNGDAGDAVAGMQFAAPANLRPARSRPARKRKLLIDETTELASSAIRQQMEERDDLVEGVAAAGNDEAAAAATTNNEMPQSDFEALMRSCGELGGAGSNGGSGMRPLQAMLQAAFGAASLEPQLLLEAADGEADEAEPHTKRARTASPQRGEELAVGDGDFLEAPEEPAYLAGAEDDNPLFAAEEPNAAYFSDADVGPAGEPDKENEEPSEILESVSVAQSDAGSEAEAEEAESEALAESAVEVPSAFLRSSALDLLREEAAKVEGAAVSFKQLTREHTKMQAAHLFFGVLACTTKKLLSVEQGKPFGDISIRVL